MIEKKRLKWRSQLKTSPHFPAHIYLLFVIASHMRGPFSFLPVEFISAEGGVQWNLTGETFPTYISTVTMTEKKGKFKRQLSHDQEFQQIHTQDHSTALLEVALNLRISLDSLCEITKWCEDPTNRRLTDSCTWLLFPDYASLLLLLLSSFFHPS